MAHHTHRSGSRRCSGLITAAAAAVLLGTPAPSAHAAVFQVTTGSPSWNLAANWSPAVIPNAIGAQADFGNPTGALTPTIDSGSSGFTIGTLTFTDNSVNSSTFSTGSTGSKLIFDNGGATATATIMVSGTGSGPGAGGNVSFNAPAWVFTSNVNAQIDQTNVTSATGALNVLGTVTGGGGFTKSGDGLMTFGTNAKNYTGPTVINGGRLRSSFSARPQQSATFTINAGGQFEPTVGNAAYNLGAGTVYLNGSGPISGPFTVNPGAIRPTRGIDLTIPNTNNVVLQSDTVIHMEANNGTGVAAVPTGSITFAGAISGPGKLQLTGSSSDIDAGNYTISGHGTYLGGTLVAGGVLRVATAGAHLGSGDVEVNNAVSPSSIARMEIQTGVTDAIEDTATLRLAGGGTAATADQNYIILGAGVNESVGGLVLGGVQQFGYLQTYGSSASGATNQNDEYFSGTGVVTLVPEPGAMTLLAISAMALGRRRRRAR